MAAKGQMTGMLGVYLTAVELVKRGFIVSPTSRSAQGADLLVTDQECRMAWSVQVKANASNANFWLVDAKAKTTFSPSHVYVFVNAANSTNTAPKFYVVPSSVVASAVVRSTAAKTGSVWHVYNRDEAFEDNWPLFGGPEAALPAGDAPTG